MHRVFRVGNMSCVGVRAPIRSALARHASSEGGVEFIRVIHLISSCKYTLPLPDCIEQ
jgi:hypothetical protein